MHLVLIIFSVQQIVLVSDSNDSSIESLSKNLETSLSKLREEHASILRDLSKLQTETARVLRHNSKLRTENASILRHNRRLRRENATIQNEIVDLMDPLVSDGANHTTFSQNETEDLMDQLVSDGVNHTTFSLNIPCVPVRFQYSSHYA